MISGSLNTPPSHGGSSSSLDGVEVQAEDNEDLDVGIFMIEQTMREEIGHAQAEFLCCGEKGSC